MTIVCLEDKRCFCCGLRGEQPVYARGPGFERPWGDAGLDGVDPARGQRGGLDLCAGCGLLAPDLEDPAPGISRAAAAAGAASAPYRARAARGGAWMAYAGAFADLLPAERAGWAWAAAAAEAEAAGDPAGEAAFARARAIGHLSRLFEAEFHPPWGACAGALPAALARRLARRKIGESGRRAPIPRLDPEGFALRDRAEEARFESACALVDLLRRQGRFADAAGKAEALAADPACPAHLLGVLAFQRRLAGARDRARRRLRECAPAGGGAAGARGRAAA